MFHTDLLTPYRETLTHGRNYQRPPPELVNGEEEYEVEKILDSRHFGRRQKLQYLIKWKGYPDSENQWVDSNDIFADKAVEEFQRSNSAPLKHKRNRKSTHNRHLRSSLLHYMTSPTPLHVRNADIPLDSGTNDYPVSRIFEMLIEPKHGQVSPLFIEYQDAEESPVARGDNQMEEGATGASLTTDQVPVRILSTSDIAEVRCNPDDHLSPGLPAEYFHDEYHGKFHFVPEEHAHQVHEYVAKGAAIATTCEEEYTPITLYVVSDDNHDSDKENRDPNQEDHEDAEEVPGERTIGGLTPVPSRHRLFSWLETTNATRQSVPFAALPLPLSAHGLTGRSRQVTSGTLRSGGTDAGLVPSLLCANRMVPSLSNPSGWPPSLLIDSSPRTPGTLRCIRQTIPRPARPGPWLHSRVRSYGSRLRPRLPRRRPASQGKHGAY